MHIDLKFTVTTGVQYAQRTSDFASLDECKQRLATLVGQENGTLTFDQPDGSRVILATRHIVAVECESAGDR
ncbi:hypothetical protein [Nonomuraea sp. NPDC049028]|uniref:hypothetical protein n=1 Tax=Nonomuraea sp. NPDC049028 TaxID=3364348 RepID=UPI0037238F25